LSVDIFIQHIYQRDLFGYEPLYDRYAGIFDDEAIAGGYIQKFSFVSIPIILFVKRSNLIKIFIVTIVINILGLGILMSTDRMPFFIYILGLIILIFFSKNFRFIYLINLILLLFLSTLIFQNNSIINKRYSFLYTIEKQLYNVKSEIKNLDNYEKNSKQKIDENINSIFDDEYFKIFYTGYNLWKNNPIIGTGIKSFNLICAEEYKKNVKLVCAPHAHNLYLEILVNQGSIGFTIFAVFLFFLFKRYFLDLTKLRINQTDRLLKIIFLIILIVELWPLRSYGSIFQTVNGSIFWFILALASSDKYSLK
jgi:O-antigen ligase